jgi:D-alanine-D-alanine ligase
MKRKHLGILFGGRSTEYKISLKSAVFLAQKVHKTRKIFLIGVDSKTGQWSSHDQALSLRQIQNLTEEKLNEFLTTKEIFLDGERIVPKPLVLNPGLNSPGSLDQSFDVVFPIIHGADGEDGKIQAILDFNQIPYVGSKIDGSVACMNKIFTKRLVQSLGIPTLPDIVLNKSENWEEKISKDDLFKSFQSKALFIKVAHGGSSIGVFRVTNQQELTEKIFEAFEYEDSLLIEPEMNAFEVFVAFFGPGFPSQKKISSLGCFQIGFFDYEKKYKKSILKTEIPAPFPKLAETLIQNASIKIANILQLRHLARIDFWYQKKTGEFFLNEVNTIPGLTATSLYPKLLEYEGYSHEEWIEKILISLEEEK